MCQERYQKIRRLAKTLGFPQSFLKKNQSELNQFCKTQDFLIMMRQHIHTFLNNLIFEQFNINKANKSVRVPDILSTYIQNNELVEEDKHATRQTFKFFVEPVGNNHDMIRSILKRRAWYHKVDSLKNHL